MKFKAQIISIDVMLALALFLGIIMFFMSFGADFLIPEKDEGLNEAAEGVLKNAVNYNNNSGPLVYESVVDQTALNSLIEEEYEVLKKKWRAKSDFCLYLEDGEGNLMNMKNASSQSLVYSVGSDNLMVSGIPCGSSLDSGFFAINAAAKLSDDASLSLQGSNKILVHENLAYTVGTEGFQALNIAGGITDAGKKADDSTMFLGSSKDLAIDLENRIAYAVGTEGIQALNITDLSNIRTLDGMSSASLGLNNPSSIFLDSVRNTAYIAGDHGIQALNTTNPSAITLLGNITDSANLALNSPKDIAMDAESQIIYAAGTEGVQTLNAADPSSITPLGSITDSASLALNNAAKIALDPISKTAYIVGSEGLQILNTGDPINMQPMGKISDTTELALSSPSDIFLDPDFGLAYVSSSEGVQMLDVKNPGSIAAFTKTESGVLNSPSSIFIDENSMIYITSSADSAVQILSVSWD